ncbi:hypothetical protein [Methanococcoides methylutens]|uniref:Uncharacterized protein n=1 Tax=Methanococcoides methylutens MM1 TaxID=1434104 RepID=A0A0E3SSD7_METMT|nr:hypothetical protein [Methanococcoides methylutens]AKB86091.1 hypothetical protein MCMEM_2038 [Methanococcoides methylutens MM1]
MCIKEKAREYDGETYDLVSDLMGMNAKDAEALEKAYEAKGYKAKIYCNEMYPGIYPKGDYFVYARN